MCRPPERWSSVSAAIAHAVGRARRQLDDRRAEPHPRGLAAPPRQRRVGVRAPRLGGEHGVEAGLLGRGDEFRRGWSAAARPSIRAADPSFIAASPSDPSLQRLLEPVLLDAVTTSQSSPVQIDEPRAASFGSAETVIRLHPFSRTASSSQFFTALRERHVVGVRGSDGRVLVPPAEFDPVTYEPLTEIVPVASVGTVHVVDVATRAAGGPAAGPAVRVGADQTRRRRHPAAARRRRRARPDAISTGARVHVHWVDEPVGAITDIAYFALGDDRRGRARDAPTTATR